MFPAPQQNFPNDDEAIVNRDGTMNQIGRFYLLSLYQRTGQGTGVPATVATDIVSTGATQAGAEELSNDINHVGPTAVGSGVILFDMLPGQAQLVYNAGGNALNVYPPAGGEIDGLGANAPYILADSKVQIFTCFELQTFFSLQLG